MAVTSQMISRARDKQLRIFSLQSANAGYAIPRGHAIAAIYWRNRTANAVTGGLKIGTTAGGVDIVAAQAMGANGIGHVPDADLLKRFFSVTDRQVLYIDAVSAWNDATIDLYIVLDKLQP